MWPKQWGANIRSLILADPDRLLGEPREGNGIVYQATQVLGTTLDGERLLLVETCDGSDRAQAWRISEFACLDHSPSRTVEEKQNNV